jgi:hydrogenase maturation protease
MTGSSLEAAPIAVIGIGNVLLGDDGVGPYVVELLRAGWEFPDGVVLIDAGTPSLELVGLLHGRDRVILVDAVSAAGDPGEIRLYDRDDLARMPLQPRVSVHDPAVHEALAVVGLTERPPREVLLVGVIPHSCELQLGLTAAVRAAAALAAERVVAELSRYGVVPNRRRDAQAPDAWWMSDVASSAVSPA